MDANRVQQVRIEGEGIALEGLLGYPNQPKGIVLFAHGSGSGRMSPRNQAVARRLREMGLATLLLDLLTEDEERIDRQTSELRFNIGFLAKRLLLATEWVSRQPTLRNLGIGYFGASTGAGAALVAAAVRRDLIQAVVSRGGRPDLAVDYLRQVQAPTLLLVGSLDHQVLALNREAQQQMIDARTRLDIIPDATHLFEEPGALELVAERAGDWFTARLHPMAEAIEQHAN